MSVNNRFLFMFLVFMAILLPLYGCGGGESGGEAGAPPASQPSTPPASQPSAPPASQPSATEYSPSDSIQSCSVPSLLTNYTRSFIFVGETGNNFGSYTYCRLLSRNNFLTAFCGSLHTADRVDLELAIGGTPLSANTAIIEGTGSAWDGDSYQIFSLSSGTMRLTNGRSRLRIENYRIRPGGRVSSLWFDGGCYDPSSGNALLTENADIEETPLSEKLSAMDEFLSNYDPDSFDYDEDFDGLDTDLGRVKTDGSEIEE